MGLQDILNGMMNGPHGQPHPAGASAKASAGGGMSPITMALLGLVAYKAVKSFGGGQSAVPGGAGRPASLPSGGTAQAGSPGGGGLGDLLGGLFGGAAGGAKPGGLSGAIPGGLGGLLGGAAAGGVLSGGLDRLIKDFQGSGQGRAAQSWIGKGPNEEIAPGRLEAALGTDTVDTLARQTGMSRNDLLAGLSRSLPDFIDQLTPDGRLPTKDEASRLI
jgi:uncharacterized protein YidB (DUF937 family)